MKTGTRRSRIDPDAAPPDACEISPREQSELLPAVDAALREMVGRGLVDSIEVVDLLLDLRSRIVLERAFEQMTNPNRSTNGA